MGTLLCDSLRRLFSFGLAFLFIDGVLFVGHFLNGFAFSSRSIADEQS
jgi:hypothetical protein